MGDVAIVLGLVAVVVSALVAVIALTSGLGHRPADPPLPTAYQVITDPDALRLALAAWEWTRITVNAENNGNRGSVHLCICPVCAMLVPDATLDDGRSAQNLHTDWHARVELHG